MSGGKPHTEPHGRLDPAPHPSDGCCIGPPLGGLAMRRLLLPATFAVVLAFASACTPTPAKPTEPAPAAATPAAAVPYGANKDAGGTFVHDGVTLYYETYGQGEPLLLIHGNGGSIGMMSAQ